MPPSFDLHTHSTASDGALAPAELARQAAAAGISHLALSDHDCTDGLDEARAAAGECGLTLIPAVEISVSWHGKSVHIVGLNIDPTHPELRQGLAELRDLRLKRAEEMGRRLANAGVEGAFEGASALAGEGMITRTHFALHMVERGLAANVQAVFDRYLGQGKPGYSPTQWAGMEQAVGWIARAGGAAAIAHPMRYKLTRSWLGRLLLEFKACGGHGIEVVSGAGNPADIQAAAAAVRRHGLLASAGSDFHGPAHPWLRLGRLPPLPEDLTPIWSLWRER
jgi:predicted metal-dependent phosphoesterase TrpH